jgi:HAMP domain-containing protein
VILAYPVLDEQGRLTAVIYAALDLVVASRAVTGAYPGVPLVWAVVDEQGLVLLHSRPETASGIPLGPLPGMLRGETIVSGTKWHSVVGMPQDLVTARVRETFLRIGLPAGLILLISAAVGFWIAYRTWRPIRDLTSAVRRVGTGESTVQIPVQAGGEVGELAATFAETLAAVNRRRGELVALLEAGRAIASSLDLEQSLQAIIQQATIISGSSVVRLLLLDADGKVLRCRAGVGLPMEEERELVIPVGESFSGQVVATGKPLAVADTRDDQRLRYPLHTTRYGLISYLGLPVKLGDRVIGVLVFNTDAPRLYGEEEIAFLSAFADQAAIAIENARLFQEQQTGRRQLEAIRAVTTEITRELDLDAVLGLIIRRAN